MPNKQQVPFQRNQPKPAYKNYNNFEDMNNQFKQLNINKQQKFVNYNNFEPDPFMSIYQQLRSGLTGNEINDKEQAGDFIYEIVERMYKPEAGKITGMLLEYPIEKLQQMILMNPNELKEQIINGHNLIQS